MLGRQWYFKWLITQHPYTSFVILYTGYRNGLTAENRNATNEIYKGLFVSSLLFLLLWYNVKTRWLEQHMFICHISESREIPEQGTNKEGFTLKPFLDMWAAAMTLCGESG